MAENCLLLKISFLKTLKKIKRAALELLTQLKIKAHIVRKKRGINVLLTNYTKILSSAIVTSNYRKINAKKQKTAKTLTLSTVSKMFVKKRNAYQIPIVTFNRTHFVY